jgi:hypothetical protein
LCGDEEGIYGKKAVCCGEHGIDRHCLNARANLGNNFTAGNWCMACTGNDDRGGLTGCSTPKPPPSNGQLPTTGIHLRCSFDNGSDNNVDAVLNSDQALNNNLTYLAITGREVRVGPSDLHTWFPNLKHLDMAGSGASGWCSTRTRLASRWAKLEHVNVSECYKLCSKQTACFELDWKVMTSLRVLDMSAMGLYAADATKLESLKKLTSLEELYLNNNDLSSLPDNFFDNMLLLTKLRVRGNPIRTTLSPEIYMRVPSFDYDVEPGQTPGAGMPTQSPTVQQPSAFPTRARTAFPTTSAPVVKPSTTVYILAGVATLIAIVILVEVTIVKPIIFVGTKRIDSPNPVHEAVLDAVPHDV